MKVNIALKTKFAVKTDCIPNPEINANDKNITDTLVAAKKELGTVEEEKKQAEKAAAACKCPENAKLAGIFLEASTHADGFKKAAYKKVAYAIQNLNFIFGSEGTATGTHRARVQWPRERGRR